MAYKFQIGDAILSGALEAELGLSGSHLSGTGIALDDAAGLVANGLENSSGKLAIKLNGSTGIAVGASGISLSAVPDSSLATISTGNKVSLSALNIAGASALGAAPASTDTIAMNDDGTGNRKMTVANLESYMQSNLTFTTNTDVDVSKANLISRLASFDSGDTVNIGDADDDTTVVIRGNLQVDGTTTTINSTTLSVDDRKIVIGDGLTTLAQGSTNEAGFEIGNGFAKITMASASFAQHHFVSNIPFSSSMVIADDANFGGIVDITSAHLSSSAPVSASAFFGDGSALTNVQADGGNSTGIIVRQYSTASATPIDLNGVAGFYVANSANGSSANAITLHLSGGAGGWSNGDAVYVKAYDNVAVDNRPLTIVASGSGAGADTIDGESQILIESNNGAVSLIFNAGNWSIF